MQEQLEELAERFKPYLRLQFVALLVGGIYLLLFAALGASWFVAQSSQTGLQDQINRQSAILERAVTRGEEVETEYEEVQEAIPKADLQETDIFRDIFTIAERNGVDITMTFQGRGQEQLGTQVYQALTFQLNAIGNQESVLAFFDDMDVTQSLLETLIVKNASLRLGPGGTLSMAFTVYTHTS